MVKTHGFPVKIFPTKPIQWINHSQSWVVYCFTHSCRALFSCPRRLDNFLTAGGSDQKGWLQTGTRSVKCCEMQWNPSVIHINLLWCHSSGCSEGVYFPLLSVWDLQWIHTGGPSEHKFQGLLNMEIKVGMATGPHQVSSACPLMAQHLNAKLAQFVRGSNWVVNSSHQLADLGGPNSCRSTRVCGFLHINVAMWQGQMQFAWVGTLGTELDVLAAFQAWQIIPYHTPYVRHLHTFGCYCDYCVGLHVSHMTSISWFAKPWQACRWMPSLHICVAGPQRVASSWGCSPTALFLPWTKTTKTSKVHSTSINTSINLWSSGNFFQLPELPQFILQNFPMEFPCWKPILNSHLSDLAPRWRSRLSPWVAGLFAHGLYRGQQLQVPGLSCWFCQWGSAEKVATLAETKQKPQLWTTSVFQCSWLGLSTIEKG